MISAKFLLGNVLLGGKLQIGAKNSNFEIFESALYMKSVSMPLTKKRIVFIAHRFSKHLKLLTIMMKNTTIDTRWTFQYNNFIFYYYLICVKSQGTPFEAKYCWFEYRADQIWKVILHVYSFPILCANKVFFHLIDWLQLGSKVQYPWIRCWCCLGLAWVCMLSMEGPAKQ